MAGLRGKPVDRVSPLVLMVLSCYADHGALLTVTMWEHLLALASGQGCWFVAWLLEMEMLLAGL